MKTLALLAILALSSCTTITAPDGTVTKSPDNAAISQGLTGFFTLLPYFFPADQPAKVVPSK